MAILRLKDPETGEIIDIPAIKGETGKDGAPGKDGTDGKDGKDGGTYITLVCNEYEENSNINYPVSLDINKKYNVAMQFSTATPNANEFGLTYTPSETFRKYLENAQFVLSADGRYVLEVDYENDDPSIFVGVYIYANMFYDETKTDGVENGPGAKDGWVHVQSEFASGGYVHKYVITISEVTE